MTIRRGRSARSTSNGSSPARSTSTRRSGRSRSRRASTARSRRPSVPSCPCPTASGSSRGRERPARLPGALMDAAALRDRTGAPLIADGGMGTSLIDTGVALDACMEALNEREPDRVTSIHASFVAAGSQLVLTNTFGATRYRLERHGLSDRVAALCAAGVACARTAGPELVGGSLGPLGVRLQPYGRVDPAG